MLLKRLSMVLLIAVAGCSTNPYEDAAVDIRPMRPSEVLSVEMESGDMICVIEKNNPNERLCVPRVHEEPGDS